MQNRLPTSLLLLALGCTLASTGCTHSSPPSIRGSITEIPVLSPLPAPKEAHIKTVLGTHYSVERANYMRALFNKMELDTEIHYDAPYFWYSPKNQLSPYLIVTSPGIDMYGKWSYSTSWHAHFAVDCKDRQHLFEVMNMKADIKKEAYVDYKDLFNHIVVKKYCNLIERMN